MGNPATDAKIAQEKVEQGQYADKTMYEILDDFVRVRGDIGETYAQGQIARIVASRERVMFLQGLTMGAEASAGHVYDYLREHHPEVMIDLMNYTQRLADSL